MSTYNKQTSAAAFYAIGLRSLASCCSEFPNVTQTVIELAKELPIPPMLESPDGKSLASSAIFGYVDQQDEFCVSFQLFICNGSRCTITWRIVNDHHRNRS